MRKIKFLILLVCIISAILVAPVSAQESDPPGEASPNGEVSVNAQALTRPNLGIAESDLAPGTNGYKVFNPGAIKTLTSQPIDDGDLHTMRNVTRTGYTDVWGEWGGVFQNWKFTGSHTSDSTIIENKIWADGFLKYWGQGWRSTCSKRLRGSRAHCNTTFSGWYNLVYGETLHHFEAPGYPSGNLRTGDSY